MKKAKGGRPLENRSDRPTGSSPNAARSDETTTETLADLGIAKQQSFDWQERPDVPEDVFEQALADPDTKPMTGGVIVGCEAANDFRGWRR